MWWVLLEVVHNPEPFREFYFTAGVGGTLKVQHRVVYI